MPKYFCDYCDTYLTHDSPSVRKTHCSGRKHKDNVRIYYQTWMEEQAQALIDKTTKAFQKGQIANNPFGMHGVAIPPPNAMGGMAGPMGMGGPQMMGGGPNMMGPMPVRPMVPVMMMGARPGMMMPPMQQPPP